MSRIRPSRSAIDSGVCSEAPSGIADRVAERQQGPPRGNGGPCRFGQCRRSAVAARSRVVSVLALVATAGAAVVAVVPAVLAVVPAVVAVLALAAPIVAAPVVARDHGGPAAARGGGPGPAARSQRHSDAAHGR